MAHNIIYASPMELGLATARRVLPVTSSNRYRHTSSPPGASSPLRRRLELVPQLGELPTDHVQERGALAWATREAGRRGASHRAASHRAEKVGGEGGGRPGGFWGGIESNEVLRSSLQVSLGVAVSVGMNPRWCTCCFHSSS